MKAPLSTATKPADPGLARQRLRLWLQMLKAARFTESRLRSKLREGHGMTLPRFDVLAALHASPEGLTMTELSQQLVVSNGNVTGIVERLVADGQAERETLASDRPRSICSGLTSCSPTSPRRTRRAAFRSCSMCGIRRIGKRMVIPSAKVAA